MPNGSIRRYLANLLVPQRISDERRSASSSAEKAGQSKHRPIFIESINEHWNAEERAHREQEKKYWKWSLGLSGGAAAVALIGTGLAFSAFVQTRRQADAADESNRPWLEAETAIVKKVSHSKISPIGEEFVVIEANLVIKNHGHSPAVQIFAASTFRLFGTEMRADFDEFRQVCLASKWPRDNYVGTVVFPEQKGVIVSNIAYRSFPEIRKVYNDREALLAESMRMNVSEYMTSANLQFIGCLLYSDNSRRIHRTSFDFILDKVDISKPGKSSVNVRSDPYIISGSYAD